MKNNKGFSLVELLGVITILGILMSIAIIAYSRYIDSSKNKAYKTMRESAISAMDEYLMDHPDAPSATIADLVEGEYLEYAADPSDKTKQCRGKVELVSENDNDPNALAYNDYRVIICCANYNHTYTTADKHDYKDNKCALD